MSNFSDMLSKAKKMQEKMKEVQDLIRKIEVQGQSGGNLVKVTLTGEYELKSIELSDEAKKEKQDDSVINQIKDILNTKIRPAVAKDGGNIQFKSFKDGVVKVELQGSCSGCPSSLMTLKQGVQNLLCHYVKEVKSVETE